VIAIAAPAYVPYEPRTQQQRELRADLQRKLRDLKVGSGQILWGTFAGPLPAGADVENALFYNLGSGAFARSMDNGAAFELEPNPLVAGVRYTYRAGLKDEEFTYWRPTRKLASIAVSGMPATLASIWWALRSVPGSIQTYGEVREVEEPFAATLNVEGPVRSLTPSLVKAIVDGIVCGLQSQSDQVGASSVAPLIATPLSVRPDAVVAALTNAGPSALGVRTSLVHARGKGVQWAPDDDRCVAARLLLNPASHWRVSGSVSTVAATAG